jgi:hypothetical protein
MARVVHFEIHAENPDRAITFYAKVFGWDIKQWVGQEYWLITTGPDSQPGINGGLTRRRGSIDGQAVIAYVCTIDVPSIEESAKTISANGGSIVVPTMPVPGVGWLAYGKDTEGNIFGIMQSDPTAK